MTVDSDSHCLVNNQPPGLSCPPPAPHPALLMAQLYYVGVDVGTASVRAALVTREGVLRATAEEPISIWEPQSDHYVQSSTEIWEKCCTVVKVQQWVIYRRHNM